MREIKFRGRRRNGEWIHGALIPAELSWWGVPSIADKNFRYEVDPETVGQYTGTCDSEDTPIYEGDVIQITHRKRATFGVVCFANAGFRVKNRVQLRENDLFSVMFYKDVHVIGNIFDNPELGEGCKL